MDKDEEPAGGAIPAGPINEASADETGLATVIPIRDLLEEARRLHARGYAPVPIDANGASLLPDDDLKELESSYPGSKDKLAANFENYPQAVGVGLLVGLDRIAVDIESDAANARIVQLDRNRRIAAGGPVIKGPRGRLIYLFRAPDGIGQGAICQGVAIVCGRTAVLPVVLEGFFWQAPPRHHEWHLPRLPNWITQRLKRRLAPAASQPHFQFEWPDTIETQADEWLVKGVLPRKGVGAIYGPSGSGKSFAALDIGLRIASGLQVFGSRTRRAGVLYVGAEAPNGLRKRVDAWFRHHVDQDRFTPFALIDAAPNFKHENTIDIQIFRAAVHEHMEDFQGRGAPLGLIVVDTFARVMAGLEENDSAAMGAAIKALGALARDTNTLVLMVHHSGKDLAKKERGHSSLRAALDVSLEVTVPDAERFGRSVTLSKSKEGEDGRVWPFRLEPVDLGEDGDGDPVRSCVAIFEEEGERIHRVPIVRASAYPWDRLKGSTRIVFDVIAASAEPPTDAGCRWSVDEHVARERAIEKLRDPSNDHPDKSAATAWRRAIIHLTAEKIIDRDGARLLISELAVHGGRRK